MTIACYLEPTKPKAEHWMRAFAKGCNGEIIHNGKYSEANCHVVMGNWPVAIRLIRKFRANGDRFFYLDSGYIQMPGLCHLRVEPGRFWPVFHGKHPPIRVRQMGVMLRPWRRDGTHVLICQHGWKFGLPWGIDIVAWHKTIEAKVQAVTNRPVIVRPKLFKPTRSMPSLADQLKDAWCLVTHSSTAAVTAAIMGVPVFCAPTCGAAAVGCTDFSQIENPLRPDRETWIAELAWRQFSQDEMQSGMAWTCCKDAR